MRRSDERSITRWAHRVSRRSQVRGGQRRDANGFAYLWTLLLVAFMGVGLTVAVEVDATLARRSQERALINIGHQFRSAIERYYEGTAVAGQRQYPTSLEDLLRDNRVPGIKRHLRQVFVDPVTGKAEWGLMRVGGRIVGVYSLSEATPIKQDNFEAEDMALRGKGKYSEWVFTYPVDLLLRDPAQVAASVAGGASGVLPTGPGSLPGTGPGGLPGAPPGLSGAASAPFIGSSAPASASSPSNGSFIFSSGDPRP